LTTYRKSNMGFSKNPSNVDCTIARVGPFKASKRQLLQPDTGADLVGFVGFVGPLKGPKNFYVHIISPFVNVK